MAIFGTPVLGDQNDNVLHGGEGSADHLNGMLGNDTLWGYAGDDLLIGNMGDDLLSAGAGDDLGFGGTGNDSIWMGTGNDFADGGRGSDLIGGGAGNDVLWGDNGYLDREISAIEWATDYIGDFDSTDDIAEAINALEALAQDLVGNYGQDRESHDTIWASTGNDLVFGGLGNDSIGGGTGNDALSGGRGNDTVYGFEGDDIVFGNDEDDLLFGGAGDDVIFDGGGRDTIWGGGGDDLMYAGNEEGHRANDLVGEDGPDGDVLDWDFDRSLDNDEDVFGFQGCHGEDTILAFDARKGYQNEEDLIDLREYGYGSMDDVTWQIYETVEEYNGRDDDTTNDIIPEEGREYDGVAFIQNPDCCDCCGDVNEANTIAIAYIGDFTAANILI